MKYTPRNPDDARQVEACAMREQGITIKDISAHFGVHGNTIQKWTSESYRSADNKHNKTYRDGCDVMAKNNAKNRRNGKLAENKAAWRAKQADLPWERTQEMQDLYAFCHLVNKYFGIPLEVDHIHPLEDSKSPGHVYDNLQILPMWENRAKSDKELDALYS